MKEREREDYHDNDKIRLSNIRVCLGREGGGKEAVPLIDRRRLSINLSFFDRPKKISRFHKPCIFLP